MNGEKVTVGWVIVWIDRDTGKLDSVDPYWTGVSGWWGNRQEARIFASKAEVREEFKRLINDIQYPKAGNNLHGIAIRKLVKRKPLFKVRFKQAMDLHVANMFIGSCVEPERFEIVPA